MGTELVPGALLPDSGLCQERPFHSGGRNVGGNGNPDLANQSHLVVLLWLLPFNQFHEHDIQT